jgi:hypothetical protein
MSVPFVIDNVHNRLSDALKSLLDRRDRRQRRGGDPPVGSATGPGDPNPPGPRPSGRRGATAAGPARPHRPALVGITPRTPYGLGA